MSWVKQGEASIIFFSLLQSIKKQVDIRGVQDEDNVKEEEQNMDKTAATHQ
jgi:hypothetical protein